MRGLCGHRTNPSGYGVIRIATTAVDRLLSGEAYPAAMARGAKSIALALQAFRQAAPCRNTPLKPALFPFAQCLYDTLATHLDDIFHRPARTVLVPPVDLLHDTDMTRRDIADLSAIGRWGR